MRPVLDREFFGFARTRRFFVLRAGVFFFPFALFAGFARAMEGLPNDLLGRAIVWSTMSALLLVVLLVTPGMLATVVPAERHRSRLDVLRSTPLSAWSLVLGKYLGRVALLALTVVTALPVPAMALLLGGTRPSQFLHGAATILATAAWVGAVSLLASASAADVGRATRRAYAWAAFAVLAPYVLLLVGRVALGPRAHGVLSVLAGTNPFTVLRTTWGRAAVLDTGPLLGYLGLAGVVTVAALALAVARVRRDPRANAGGARPRTPTARDVVRLERRPLEWLEERRRAAHRRPALRAVLVLEVFLLLVWWWTGQGVVTHATAAVIAAGIALVVAALEGATAFRRDDEANTAEVLRATPAPVLASVDAKLRAAQRAWFPWWILGSLHALAAAALDGKQRVLPTALCALIAWLMLHVVTHVAARIGLTAPSTQVALGRVFGGGVALLVLVPCIALPVSDVYGVLVAFLLGWHPIAVAGLPFWWTEGVGGRWEEPLRILSFVYLVLHVVLLVFLRRTSLPEVARRRERGD